LTTQIQYQGGSAVPFLYTEEQQAIFDEIIAPTTSIVTIKATAG